MGLMDEYKERKRQIITFVVVLLLVLIVLGLIPLIVLSRALGQMVGM